MTSRPPQRRFFRLFMLYWLPVLIYITAIIALSAQPNLQPPLRFPNADKVYHLVEYLGLGFLLARAWHATAPMRRPLSAALVALSCGVVVGSSDEYFQSFIPGRQSSAFDLLADAAGLALAQFAYLRAFRA